MNLGLFDEFMGKRRMPSQCRSEWLRFLELCETYLKKHEIENPIVVELGIGRNRQKKFYEQLLGAEHIGIDIQIERFPPEILGDTHNPKILKALKRKLNGRPINILFIDADHSYRAVKRDFEIYSPLCSDIIAFHDIDNGRYQRNKRIEVWKFWDELKIRKHEDFSFISIEGEMGTGVMIKKEAT